MAAPDTQTNQQKVKSGRDRAYLPVGTPWRVLPKTIATVETIPDYMNATPATRAAALKLIANKCVNAQSFNKIHFSIQPPIGGIDAYRVTVLEFIEANTKDGNPVENYQWVRQVYASGALSLITASRVEIPAEGFFAIYVTTLTLTGATPLVAGNGVRMAYRLSGSPVAPEVPLSALP